MVKDMLLETIEQANDIKKIANENGFSCEIFKDYGSNDRVALLRWG